MKIKIDRNKFIGDNQPCFIIAEIGSNHNQDINLAYKLIDAAYKAGADAVKFQTFRASSHFSKYSPGFDFLNNKPMYDLIKSLELNRSWQKKLKKFSENRGLVFFSSPCDDDAIESLSKLKVQLYKVASFDISDLNLIYSIAKQKKPIIISTGMANNQDIENAISSCKKAQNKKIILLQCTSLYPTPSKLSNLNAIVALRKKYGYLTGFSDHTLGDHMPVSAVALGACVIEKHFTINKNLKGPDHKFAMEPLEFKTMVNKIREVESGLGDGKKIGPLKEENEMAKKGRRSLHAAKTILAGEKIKKEMLTAKRPGLGILPSKIKKVVGKRAKKKILEDKWITWKMIK